MVDSHTNNTKNFKPKILSEMNTHQIDINKFLFSFYWNTLKKS